METIAVVELNLTWITPFGNPMVVPVIFNMFVTIKLLTVMLLAVTDPLTVTELATIWPLRIIPLAFDHVVIRVIKRPTLIKDFALKRKSGNVFIAGFLRVIDNQHQCRERRKKYRLGNNAHILCMSGDLYRPVSP